jgi:hypothetical protein
LYAEAEFSESVRPPADALNRASFGHYGLSEIVVSALATADIATSDNIEILRRYLRDIIRLLVD